MLHPLLRAVISRILALKRSIDFALLLVDVKIQAPFNEATNGAHHAFSRTLAAHIDVAVVGVTAEAQSSLLQELVVVA
jgi:hypothetical protein